MIGLDGAASSEVGEFATRCARSCHSRDLLQQTGNVRSYPSAAHRSPATPPPPAIYAWGAVGSGRRLSARELARPGIAPQCYPCGPCRHEIAAMKLLNNGAMAKDFAAKFRIKPGTRVHLGKLDAADASAFPDRKAAEHRAAKDGALLSTNGRTSSTRRASARSWLCCSGRRYAGKDGTVRHVFNQTGPLGVTVTSFRAPSEKELAHDFLWRAHVACPRRGFIGIFNRSHYEDVLVGRVRELAPKKVIEQRLRANQRVREDAGRERHNRPEVHVAHIQRRTARASAGARLDEPESRWKFNQATLKIASYGTNTRRPTS